MEFRDLNLDYNAFQRKFVDEIRRIELIERRMAYIYAELVKDGIVINVPKDEPRIPGNRDILNTEYEISDLETHIHEINDRLKTLKLKQLQYLELQQVLLKTNKLIDFTNYNNGRHLSIGGMEFHRTEDGTLQSAAVVGLRDPARASEKLHLITGVIRAEKTEVFHRLVWRSCSNNVLVQFFDIENPIYDIETEEVVKKKVFLVICQGEHLNYRVRKICDGYRATIYAIPNDNDYYRQMCVDVNESIEDLKVVIDQTLTQKQRLLVRAAEPSAIPTWSIQVTKLKSVFASMNRYRKTEKGFLAECWCAKSDFHRLKSKVDQIVAQSGVPGQVMIEKIGTEEEPPTFYRLNKFTQGFQNIVDSYGVANYQEMNPAPYTIISFPFLFAVMFADAGHGLIMMLFALWMVLFERKLTGKSNDEIWLTFFDGRYIILLMGMFSIYTGFIYNDIFAKSMNIFGTSFAPAEPSSGDTINGTTVFFFEHDQYLNKTDTTYPFGVDAVWQLSKNKILFLNSYKMKLSIILGVTQMLFGVILSLFNHVHFRNYLSILFEFFPQVIFLLSLFGYLIFLIYLKWFRVFDPFLAPSILIDFINMFLYKYPDDGSYLAPWFDNKMIIQTILLVAALSCVPVMLLVKPCILVCCMPKKSAPDVESSASGGAEESHEESAMDIFIHQAIHTIEYCLGSISHTASYLRLWALSLAHSQLSEVLWNMVMTKGYASDMESLPLRALFTFFTFGFWAVLTVAILIVMEGLSAFLHALRLHWVEFQSKFYSGSGYCFKPFHFKTILAEQLASASID